MVSLVQRKKHLDREQAKITQAAETTTPPAPNRANNLGTRRPTGPATGSGSPNGPRETGTKPKTVASTVFQSTTLK